MPDTPEPEDITLWQREAGYDVTDDIVFHGPPGTGKTTTALRTVHELITEHDYTVNDVAWVTYRRRLAEETLTRLSRWGILDSTQLADPSSGATRYISTAHAVGNRCGAVARPAAARWQKQQFCNNIGVRFTEGERWEKGPGELLFATFGWMANQRATPHDTETLNTCPHYHELQEKWDGDIATVWEQWNDYKEDQELIDFYEQLEMPLELGYSPNRPILIIDEYHDVTKLMHELFLQWMEDAEIVLVLGDPHQVVNSFEGADPKYFNQLENEMNSVQLPVTWRVGPEQWRLATHMLGQSIHTPPDIEFDSNTSLIREYNSPTFQHQHGTWMVPSSEHTPGSPAWLLNEYQQGSTAFLTRTRMQAHGVGKALEDAGIPYTSQTGLFGWNTDNGSEIRRGYNALDAIRKLNPANFEQSQHRIQQFDTSQIRPSDIEITNGEAAFLLRAAHASHLSVTRDEASEIVDDIEETPDTLTIDEFDRWCDSSFWNAYTDGSSSVQQLNKSGIDVNSKHVDRVRSAIKQALTENTGRYTLTENINSIPDDISGEQINTLVLTIHGSKGIEADDVVVYDGISKRTARQMRERPQERANEYRTWFVALTRANKRIHVMRNGFDWTQPMIPDIESVFKKTSQ